MTISAQNKSEIPLIGEEAPGFKAISTNGSIDFPNEFGTSWKILLSHPRDFTPVCSSEIIELAHMQDQFKELNTQIVVLSTEDVTRHIDWKAALEELMLLKNEPEKIEFPLVEDKDYTISRKYGMLHEEVSTTKDVRGVFIIDPDNIIRSIQFYPMEVGRNFNEIKRSLIALQTTVKYSDVLTPANWEPGKDVLVKFMSGDEADKYDNAEELGITKDVWFMTWREHKYIE
jgi:peroxiredoxin (alkyl hydroperoxide reductase subunit C)